MPSLNSFSQPHHAQRRRQVAMPISISTPPRATASATSRACPIRSRCCWKTCLRTEDGVAVKKADIAAIAGWLKNRGKDEVEIAFSPARVLMQDFTGVPAVVDLAAMRDAAAKLGADPERINPLVPVDLVIDHSVMVDHFAGARFVQAERRSRISSATASATNSCAGASARSAISASCRPAPASATRSISNISAKACGRARKTAKPSPIPTRWSAPTATPP